MEASDLPSYCEGQVVCVLLPHHTDKRAGELWQLAVIKKIKRRTIEGVLGDPRVQLEMKLIVYRIKEEISKGSMKEWHELYPTARLPNELVILSRLKGKMPLDKNERVFWSVRITGDEIGRRVCPATAEDFEKRLRKI